MTNAAPEARLRAMGMHIDPVPTGNPEFNENELEEQNLERGYERAMAEKEAESATPKKPGFFARLFGKK
ncbi:MAG TPA: hypothetical protein VID47_09880 [Actinomycetota bacterium]